MNRGVLYYVMIPLVILASLLQSTALGRIEIRGVKPDLVLLLIIAGALIYGGRPGLVWAFIGGITMDIFSGGPMGASSLALMTAALATGLGHRTLSRYNLLVPLGATAIGTAIYGLSYLMILLALDYFAVVQHRVPLGSMIQFVIGPAILYNVVLMLAAMPLMNRLPESQDI